MSPERTFDELKELKHRNMVWGYLILDGKQHASVWCHSGQRQVIDDSDIGADGAAHFKCKCTYDIECGLEGTILLHGWDPGHINGGRAA